MRIAVSYLWWFAIAVSIGCTEHATDTSAPLPVQPAVSADEWAASLLGLAANYEEGQTSKASEVACEQLVQAITNEFHGTWIEFEAPIERVAWSNGRAYVYYQLDFEERVADESKAPYLHRVAPIVLRMSEEEAAAIPVGTELQFKGGLRFLPRKWGGYADSHGMQSMLAINCPLLSTYPIGSFATDQFQVTIDGMDVEEQWSR